jgi:quercetin dioxygenase-like cupin family protein
VGRVARAGRHPRASGTRELLTVTDGEIVLSVAGEEIVLHPGDAASFHGDVVREYRNDGGAAARFALMVYESAAPR